MKTNIKDRERKVELTVSEIEALMDACLDSELYNLYQSRRGHNSKPISFLRDKNSHSKTAYEKLNKARFFIYHLQGE
tara:strand:- start:33 stop:263 length:231 start_codon:yes stop_codon:yes gene_type:complete